INRMASAASFSQLSDRIAELSVILPYWNDLYVCMRDDMNTPAPDSGLPELPSQMHLFVSIHQHEPRDKAISFSTCDFLPDTVCGEGAKLMIAVPLHNTEIVFGYIVTTYSDSKYYVFDDLYFSWRDSVANALSVQYIKTQNRLLTQRLETYSERDRMTGMLNLKGLTRKLVSGRKYACITLIIQWLCTAAQTVRMTPELFVANAIQMNCKESELCFRYNKDVFGILLTPPDRMDMERACEEWVLRFNTFADYLRQRDKQLERPVIRIYYDSFQEQTETMQESLEHLLEGHLQQNQPAPTVSGGMSEQLEEMRRQIIREPSKDWTQAKFAEAMQISDSYFRRLYKQHFGIPFHTDLIHLRMSHAMKLLRETDMNIKLIAEQCGYTNTYHFMTAFKKETGLTATEYRSAKRRTE
ncbi:MAG: helix-turn-helix transcriptional regulator, partial [Oscillospiraceae bacterium]|nr:helix-turn-helix transcriptional regulator [Oscillospiraceae bacterium]